MILLCKNLAGTPISNAPPLLHKYNDLQFIFIFFFATLLSCSIAWLTPPFSIPDEGAHYLRTYEVSRGHWINSVGNVGVSIPCVDYLIIAKQYAPIAFYQSAAEDMQPNPIECLASTRNTAGTYSPIPYVAAAFGIRIAEKLGFNVESRLKAGRIANAITTSLICLLSVLAVRQHRLLLASFALLPMTMWLRASMSADAMTITISISYLAFILRLTENRTETTIKIFFALSLLAVLLGSMKPVYGILCFASLILYRHTCDWRKNLLNISAISAASIAGVAAGFIWSLTPDSSLIYINTFGGADPFLQWHYILSNPIGFFHVIAKTIKNNLSNYIGQALLPTLSFVPQLGTPDKIFPASILSMCLFLTILTTPTSLKKWQCITLCCVATICLFATLLPLYLTYTLVGHTEIIGLQGRYFLPPAFYAMGACCISKPQQLFAGQRVRLATAIATPLVITTILAIYYFS